MAVVSSLRSFDREQQKEFLIPIVIKDSGNPSMSGTSTLTVIIGDVNDNKMQPGSKEIFVYNYVVSIHAKRCVTRTITLHRLYCIICKYLLLICDHTVSLHESHLRLLWSHQPVTCNQFSGTIA